MQIFFFFFFFFCSTRQSSLSIGAYYFHGLMLLGQAQAKKLRAERLLAKIEASMVPSGPDYDQETITDEERAMFRRVGLRMKAYLPLGG